MKIEINRINDAINFEASNSDGNKVLVDGAASYRGTHNGMRPMELLLVGVGTCSAFDIVEILKKQRQDLKDMKISVEGAREPDATPAPFKQINIHFTLIGNVDKAKAERAVDLAVNKYCSVGTMLEQTAEITYSIEIKAE